jgi:hypothetical protein
MLKTKISSILAILVLAVIFTACGSAANGTPTEAPEVIFTRVAETVFYSFTQTAEAMPTLTSTPIPPTATVTIIQLPTIQPTGSTTSPTVAYTQPVSSGPHSGDYALYLYNRPDNFHIAIGGEFSEVIGYENIGSTTWNTKYSFKFFGGTKMWDVTSIALSKEVKPGQRIEIFIAGFAPVTNGTYLNRWALYTDTGVFIPGSEMYIKVIVP